jgi:hypothetical protein
MKADYKTNSKKIAAEPDFRLPDDPYYTGLRVQPRGS